MTRWHTTNPTQQAQLSGNFFEGRCLSSALVLHWLAGLVPRPYSSFGRVEPGQSLIAGIDMVASDGGYAWTDEKPALESFAMLDNGSEAVLTESNKLPDFNSSADLKRHHLWYHYMLDVYGPSVEDDRLYPIAVAKFRLLYADIAGTTMVNEFQKIAVNANLGRRTGSEKPGMLCPRQLGQLYRCAVIIPRLGCVLDLPSWINVYQGHPQQSGIPPNTWVEVSHCVNKAEMFNVSWPGKPYIGIWFYVATGSGMWFNVGRTRVFDNHLNAVDELLSIDPYTVCRKNGRDCAHLLPQVLLAARAMGLDTIQFVRRSDMRCGNSHHEVVWVGEGNVTQSELRGGLQASCAATFKACPVRCHVNHKNITVVGNAGQTFAADNRRNSLSE
eukprot:CAMPEP_0178376226 /NCGR_PEP_ID=MMETSP0689_2-20121128/3292_1 /TAXON_ID=160604 /ORGANISM="Amphidinium massartii, Strain CS-259" /LENGTH=385 /DNA_ID=CAMNT_0019996239 /DNA_START=29 /DNA_END=1184 /DNA_ORIENTATION=+